MSALPEWLANAVADDAVAPPVPSPLVAAESSPAPGDLRPLVSMDIHVGPMPRIVLVMDVDPDLRFTTIALTTNETDLATEDDAFVSAELSGAPFDVLVELDLQGTVRSCQLGRKLGHISIDVLRDRDQAPHGVPVRSEEDERVTFKNAEFDTLYALAGEAMRAADAPEDPIITVCDPDAIRHLACTNPAMLAELIVEDAAALPGAVAEELLLEASGQDEMLLLGLLQRSIETDTPYDANGETVTAWHPAREAAPHDLLGASIAVALPPGVSEFRVATIRLLWCAGGQGPSFCEMRSRRVQFDLEYVGAS